MKELQTRFQGQVWLHLLFLLGLNPVSELSYLFCQLINKESKSEQTQCTTDINLLGLECHQGPNLLQRKKHFSVFPRFQLAEFTGLLFFLSCVASKFLQKIVTKEQQLKSKFSLISVEAKPGAKRELRSTKAAKLLLRTLSQSIKLLLFFPIS